MGQQTLTSEEIRRIAQTIARELASPQARRAAAQPSPRMPSTEGGRLGDGVFTDIDDAVKAARAAFPAFAAIGLRHRVRVIEAIRAAMRPLVEELSRRAVDETGIGRYEDKIEKNKLVIDKTPGPEILQPQAVSGDDGLMITEPAPFGTIGAITPVTNPTSTIINNGIAMLSAGNTVVFNVHPSAKRVSAWTVQLINRAIVGAGGPPNCVTCIAEPTIESAQAMMRHPLTRIIVVTGGPGVVNAAMQIPKRAICGGPGNPPAVVDPSADIAEAGRKIVYGHSFDNNIICVDEKEVIAVDRIADDLKRAMVAAGAYELDPRDLPRLERVIFSEGAGPRGHAKVNREVVGKDASVILGKLGIQAGHEVRTILVEVPNEHPLVWTEQMMPVLPITRAPTTDAAIQLAVEAEGGNFHTATMHSHDITALSKMAKLSNASIFVKNGLAVGGLGFRGEGWSSFTIASPTGEGLTTALSFSRWRRCTVTDHFRIT